MPFLNNNNKPTFLDKSKASMPQRNATSLQKSSDIKKAPTASVGDTPKPVAPIQKDPTIFGGLSEKSKYEIFQKFKNDPEVSALARKQGIPVWEMTQKLLEEAYPAKYGAGLGRSEAKTEAKNDYREMLGQIRKTVNDPKAYKETKKRGERIRFLQKKTGQKPY